MFSLGLYASFVENRTINVESFVKMSEVCRKTKHSGSIEAVFKSLEDMRRLEVCRHVAPELSKRSLFDPFENYLQETSFWLKATFWDYVGHVLPRLAFQVFSQL